MAEPGPIVGEGGASSPERPRRRRRWRPLVRSLHRDVGYLAIGLTVVYALSGLAVNHVEDWDPSMVPVDETHALPTDLPDDDAGMAKAVLASLGITEAPSEVFRIDPDRLDIVLETRTLHMNEAKGQVLEEGQRPRPVFHLVNWLHLNRGKKAWTYFADGYAVFLLFLATSGLFMIPGRKGLVGRGGLLALVGALVPILYVTLSSQ